MARCVDSAVATAARHQSFGPCGRGLALTQIIEIREVIRAPGAQGMRGSRDASMQDLRRITTARGDC